MKRKNKFYSIATILFVCISILSGCKGNGGPSAATHIIVVGDWGREGTQFQIPVRDQMVRDAKKYPVDFIISTGDNFYEDGVSSVTDSQFKTSFENIYTDSSLQISWLVSLGNHDYRNLTSPDAEIAYTSHSKRWYMPSRYYSKDYAIGTDHSVSIFIVDTSPFLEKYQQADSEYHVKSQSTDRQLAWLDSALGACKSKWKFVAGHHPIYSASAKEGNTEELVARMLPILKKNHVQAFICGHNHNLQHTRRDGMDFYVSGGGSQAKDGAVEGGDVLYAATQAGFLDLVVRGDSTVATFINPWGQPANMSSMAP